MKKEEKKLMKYKNIFQAVNEAKTKCNKSKTKIFIDIIKSRINYQANYDDYINLEMYKLNNQQKQSLLTYGINNELIRRFDTNKTDYFTDREKFNKRFNKYLLRDWLSINESEENYKLFEEFCSKHKIIIVKDDSENKIEQVLVNNKNIKSTYKKLIESKNVIVEEMAEQSSELSSLNPTCLNTIRVLTCRNMIIAAYLCIGNDKNINNDYEERGLIAPINIETGLIDYPALDKSKKEYDRHPKTNESILWFSIPKWPRIKRFILQATEYSAPNEYIEWNVCLGKKDPYIISGNTNPKYYLYQLSSNQNNINGILNKFEKIMRKKEENNESSNSN